MRDSKKRVVISSVVFRLAWKTTEGEAADTLLEKLSSGSPEKAREIIKEAFREDRDSVRVKKGEK